MDYWRRCIQEIRKDRVSNKDVRRSEMVVDGRKASSLGRWPKEVNGSGTLGRTKEEEDMAKKWEVEIEEQMTGQDLRQ